MYTECCFTWPRFLFKNRSSTFSTCSPTQRWSKSATGKYLVRLSKRVTKLVFFHFHCPEAPADTHRAMSTLREHLASVREESREELPRRYSNFSCLKNLTMQHPVRNPWRNVVLSCCRTPLLWFLVIFYFTFFFPLVLVACFFFCIFLNNIFSPVFSSNLSLSPHRQPFVV